MSDSSFENLPARQPLKPLTIYSSGSPPANGTGRPSDTAGTMSLGFVWRSVRQWWKIALPVGVLLAAVGGGIVWYTFQPTYRTTAWLLIKDQPDYLAFKNETNTRFVQNQVELLRGPVVLERVLSRPEIAKLPEVARQAAPLEWLQKNVTAKNVGGSDIFELSFTGPDPTHVTTIVNAVYDSYLEVASQSTIEQMQRVIQLLTVEKERRGKEVEQLRENVRTLTKQVTGEDPYSRSLNREKLTLHSPRAALQERLVTTEVEREILEAQMTAMTEAISAPSQEIPEEVLERLIDERPEIEKFKNEIAASRARLEETERVAQPAFMQSVLRMRSQIGSDEQRLNEFRARLKSAIGKEVVAADAKKRNEFIADLRGRVASMKRAEKLLKERVDQLTAGQIQTGDHALELEFRKGELERAENVHDRISDRILALTTETRAPERVTQLRRATVPTDAEVKSPAKILTLVGLAGLAIPFVLAIARERHIRRIVESQQILEETYLPVIGEVSMLPRRRLQGPAGARQLTWARHVFEESIDSVRTALVLSDELKELRVIAVVSAVSQEGKTSLSTQLAISLARASNSPVLLIDADLRSPDLHNIFELPRDPGLVKALTNSVAVRAAIRATAVNPLVHLLSAGRLHRSPHTLLSNSALTSLLEQVRADYRYIVIDTPPVLSASEALVVAKAADGTLICTMRDASRAGQVRMAYERLVSAGARVVGVVHSGVPTRTYAYKYGSYGYQKTS